jgi:hypothetical protein
MRSSRGEIITQALQRVGNTTTTLKVQARIRLNRILQELQQGWDWPYLWTAEPIVILTNGVVPLPANFLKAEDDQSLQIATVGGMPFQAVVTEVDHRTFALNAVTVDASATFPRFWTIDYSIPAGRSWPRARDQIAGTLRCKLLPADFPVIPTGVNENSAAYDADVPLFPWDILLTDLLFEWAMAYEVDPRRAEQMAVNAESVNRSRGASFPEKSYPTQVQLDPTIFSRPWQGN